MSRCGCSAVAFLWCLQARLPFKPMHHHMLCVPRLCKTDQLVMLQNCWPSISETTHKSCVSCHRFDQFIRGKLDLFVETDHKPFVLWLKVSCLMRKAICFKVCNDIIWNVIGAEMQIADLLSSDVDGNSLDEERRYKKYTKFVTN